MLSSMRRVNALETARILTSESTLAQRANRFDSVVFGHGQVDDDESDILLPVGNQGRYTAAVGDRGDRVSLVVKDLAEETPNSLIVIRHEDPGKRDGATQDSADFLREPFRSEWLRNAKSRL